MPDYAPDRSPAPQSKLRTTRPGFDGSATCGLQGRNKACRCEATVRAEGQPQPSRRVDILEWVLASGPLRGARSLPKHRSEGGLPRPAELSLNSSGSEAGQ